MNGVPLFLAGMVTGAFVIAFAFSCLAMWLLSDSFDRDFESRDWNDWDGNRREG